MKTIVIDDESLARDRIVSLLLEVPEIKIVEECSTGTEAINKINSIQPELIFLDINMKDMNGFEVLEKIQCTPKPIVIFVTAYDSFATKAFDVEAFDFLLKPFKDQRFFRTITKVLNLSKEETDKNFEKRFQDLLQHYSSHKKNTYTERLPIKLGNKTILIEPSKIEYIIASGCYAEIYISGKKMVIRESLNNLENLLNDDYFFRIHRSTIINFNHLKEILHSDFSEIDVKMNDDKILRISKSNKKSFLKKVGM